MNWNVPSLLTGRSSPALLRSTSPAPSRPATLPPTLKLSVAQVTATLVTSVETIVPLPLATVQVCQGVVGCAATVTA